MRIVNRGFKRVQSQPIQEPQIEEKQDFTLEELKETEEVIEEVKKPIQQKSSVKRKRNTLEELLSNE